MFKRLKSHALFFSSTLKVKWVFPVLGCRFPSYFHIGGHMDAISKATKLLSSENLLHCLKKPHTYFVFLKSSNFMRMDFLWGLWLLNLGTDEKPCSKTMRAFWWVNCEGAVQMRKGWLLRRDCCLSEHWHVWVTPHTTVAGLMPWATKNLHWNYSRMERVVRFLLVYI